MKHVFFLLAIAGGCLAFPAPSRAQTFAHEQSSTYVWPREPEVRRQLYRWQNLKFGMLIHWGLYSQLGIVESWSICSEEEEWIPRDSTVSYDAYKRAYWATIDAFKPERFDPLAWARAGKRGGMNYVVFTTKHHDGFALFDTRQSDFSILHGAFKDDPRANATREVFNAFRQEGYMIGAYFSKPDWHSPYYWWDRYATPNRNKNYSIAKNPWRWEKFKEFTYNQIEELVNGDYGKVDILWLDGGWVCPQRGSRREGQDIDMPRIAAMARGYQPGILIVDRTVEGEFENYQTPERGVPPGRLTEPWESCIPLGNDWGYVPSDVYKSPARVIHTLVEIVAKGGNLLLGIGPKADGTLPDEVVERLEKVGEWLAVNGKAIYDTRSVHAFRDGNTWFTAGEEGAILYAIACLEEGEALPREVSWRGNVPPPGSRVTCLQTGKTARWKKGSDGLVTVTLPAGLPAGLPAVAFSWPSPGAND
ncbi:MAG: alpha-L-fucosidase [Odoribacteraceae bacterium]|jgi:alpha-L-fucosidase|nr:alpha-L-fucosidase [Odoribacteraceae bacterium]